MPRDERQRNQEAYQKFKKELEQKYPGQFIGIVRGQVVAHAPTFQEVLVQLEAIEPDPSARLVFRVGESYPERVVIRRR